MNEYELLAQAKNFFVDLWESIVNFFASYKFQKIVFDLKFILIIISILLLLCIIILLFKIVIQSMLHRPLIKSRKKEPVLNKKKIKKRWKKVEKAIQSELEANYKLALIEADRIFNRVIKELGYGIEKKLSNADDIKAGAKLNSKIIEDKKLPLSKESAEKAVGAYKKGLEELGIL